MKINLSFSVYGDCFQALYYFKNYLKVNFGSSRIDIENYLKSFCAELAKSPLSNPNKELILSFILLSSPDYDYHHWICDDTRENFSYDEWLAKQVNICLNFFKVLEATELRYKSKLETNLIYEDETKYTGITFCFKSISEDNVYSINSKNHSNNLFYYYLNHIIKPSHPILRLYKETDTPNT
ncbi:MAG: hypothetical protein IJO27_05370 [Bacilli bacterium]|nr:hypothetical protein [Bacilli bacterium]